MSRQKTHGRRLGPNGECTVCGQRHQRPQPHGGTVITCAAHKHESNGGGPCGVIRPGDGGDTWTCKKHGGATPQVVAKRTRDRQRAEVEKLMLTLGEPVTDAEPGQIITERIAARAGHVRWLLERVREMDPEALAWGITKRKTAVDIDRPTDEQDTGHERRHYAGNDEGDTFEAKPSIWYAMYVEAARDLEKLCIEAIRVGLDERRVRLAEQQADVIVRVIDGMLRDLGHDPNDPRTADIVGRHLEAVA